MGLQQNLDSAEAPETNHSAQFKTTKTRTSIVSILIFHSEYLNRTQVGPVSVSVGCQYPDAEVAR